MATSTSPRRSLSVENLESRLNLSSLGGLSVPESLSVISAQERATTTRNTVLTLTDVLRQYHDIGSSTDLTGARQATSSGVAAPSSLSANSSTTSIALKWTDNSTNENGFRIYRSADGVTFAQVGSVSKGKTSYTDVGVSTGVTYSYYVVAYTSSSTSAASNTATAALAQVIAPSAPSNFTASSVTDTSVSLGWTDNASNESGVRVYRSTDGVNFSLAASLAAGSTSYTDGSLNNGSTYTYKVSSWNSGGETFAANVVSATTTTPVAPAAPGSFTTDPVTITTPNRVSFTELRIDGTSGNDSIVVTQANGVLTVTANGQTTSYANNFGDIMIVGGAGDDAITVDSSVNIATLMYGGDGNNQLTNLTTGKATIVSIGRGTNTVTGNGINTAYWVNTNDIVNATAAEINLGGVNKVGNFYQPWTTNSSGTDYISRDLYGQNFREPTDSSATTRLSGSFFGTGAVKEDINQTSLADCYFLAPLSSLAAEDPTRLQNMAVDLGDGTYAFRMYRNGVVNYVRVDGDLATGPWNGLANQMPGVSGNQWGSLFEKAYAYFRSGANTYSSLNWGYQNQSFSDLGLANSSMAANSSDTTLLNSINTYLSNQKAITAGTISSITSGAPLIGSHVYSVLGAYRNAAGTLMVTLRNPWGVDGAGWDGVDDGIVTIDANTFRANFSSIAYTT